MSTNRDLKYLLFLLTTALLSCNPDVFIEPLKTSEIEYTLPFTGGTTEIGLSHGDWDIKRIAINNVDIDINTSENGSIDYKSRFASFCVSRPTDTRLCLVLEHSSDPDSIMIGIHIANDFQSLEIPIVIEPCRGYYFDKIEYGAITRLVEDFEEIWTETINNPVIADWECLVFNEDYCRKTFFPASSVSSEDIPEAMWLDELEKYTGGPFEVPIPEPFPETGQIPDITERLKFTYKETVTSMEFASDTFKTTLLPGTNKIRMYWGFVEYTIPYTVLLSHPEGRSLSFKGEFTSKTYNGRWRVEL